MKSAYTVSYYNPDLDGVASTVGLADYLAVAEAISCTPLALGAFDAETRFVFGLVKAALPQIVDCCPEDRNVYLVDTHHVLQLKNKVPLDRVVCIYDHHPAGDPSMFPKARITNESVGAVATMLAEMYRNANSKPRDSIAALLYAAIISNTMNLTAPTTTQRDRLASTWLCQLTEIPTDLPRRMFEVKSQHADRTIREIITANAKVFVFGPIKIAISQIEGIGVGELLSRDDLNEALTFLKNNEEAQYAFLSVVDQPKQITLLYAPDKEMQALLSGSLGAVFQGATAQINRILLRKSDLVPSLTSYLKNHE